MSKKLAKVTVVLPDVAESTLPALADLTASLGVPRDVLAGDESIQHVWGELPRLVHKIPEDKRSVLHVRMCAAIAAGLFDSAINYAWNSAVTEIRQKVISFGLNIVSQVKSKQFEESDLNDLKDAELLELALKLGLISEDDYFFLDQCRDIRNAFSAAHPPPSLLDEDEVVSFISRVARHALTDTHDAQGVDTSVLLGALKTGAFSGEQAAEWAARFQATHTAQRSLIFVMLHGIYCGPASDEDTRQNCLLLCEGLAEDMSRQGFSGVVNRHSEYVAKGDVKRIKASRTFFQELGSIGLLSKHEQHSIVSRAAKDLKQAHLGFNNFHNEPSFARRLRDVTEDVEIPSSAQAEFVDSIALAGAGNPYGVSIAAWPIYLDMVRSMSPQEITLLLSAPKRLPELDGRIKGSPSCKKRFGKLVREINAKSVPAASKVSYKLMARW